MKANPGLVIVLCLIGGYRGHAATLPTVEAFAARPRIEGVSISPDGHYVAMIQTRDGRGAAVVVERESLGRSAPRVVLSEPEHFRMTWCRWATDTRLLCGFSGMTKWASTGMVYGITRLAGVDADGKNQRVMIQNSESAQGQFQDRIISWNPGVKDTVLIEADEGLSASQASPGIEVYGNVGTHALPAVFELNVVTGQLRIRQHAREPIRHWITDNRGEVRLGWGLSGASRSYFARLSGDRDWRRLDKFEVFSREKHFEPIAISADEPNKAYAFGTFEGRNALWLIDLTDQEDPSVVFAHPAVDVGRPLLAPDGKLLGVRYETDRPMVYFTDSKVAALHQSLQALAQGKFTEMQGSTRDRSLYIVRAFDDRDAPSYLLLDVKSQRADWLGGGNRDLDPSSLAPLRNVSFPARDGTRIPGYLTLPNGVPATDLPLIVMPHGGPIGRDSWSYFFLREFLANRGYAVLQMNFRGSSGYGEDWFFAAHQDWGGLTYDDVVDGTRWAIEQKIANPRRVCIVGWSFGGYLALLGAQRNADLFRCAIDIAGVSDLRLLIAERVNTLTATYTQRQIGTDPEKLKLNSPRLHAVDFSVPLLMLHGDMDAQTPFEQSVEMDSALKKAGKPHRFVAFAGADHQFSVEQDRALLLRDVEEFLGENIGPLAPSPAVAAQ